MSDGNYPVMVCKWIRGNPGEESQLAYQKVALPISPQVGMHFSAPNAGQTIQFINLQKTASGRFIAVCWLEDDDYKMDIRHRVDSYREAGWLFVSENEDAWD